MRYLGNATIESHVYDLGFHIRKIASIGIMSNKGAARAVAMAALVALFVK